MNSVKDGNFVNSLTAVSTDGKTVIAVQADSSTHRLLLSDAATGTDNGPNHALKDENDVPTALAVSLIDGKTPVALYASGGKLLIQSS